VVAPTSPLGIDVPTEPSDQRLEPPATPGLLVGRVSRRAWINSVRYDADAERFIVGIWLEPRHADIHGLVLDVREYVDEELALSAQTPLSAVHIPSRARGRIWIGLPTLGRGLERVVALYDRDGTLLDLYERFRFIESIHTTLQANGSKTTFVTGQRRPPAAITERFEAFERVERGYRDLLQSGMRRRVVETRRAAVGYLRQRLERVREEVLILHPYFGKDPSDWQILELRVQARHIEGAGFTRDSHRCTVGGGRHVGQIESAGAGRIQRLRCVSLSITAWLGSGLSVSGGSAISA
jgi:hypothetical protein